ncbi:sensor domain-containing diguanylate cyclase [Spiribacter vilamensis]|uniref:Diguanylate cyclase (GGDEF)-like protein n=1 Tax=Spiribacter vilamensis TaxID=531306 RepID=A0A4Q8D2D6_9GAMM|nr:sensor domain-containing diguanylate cyclase [Spiribacter vilamensis]RZU99571.1 diguanylate cyclase (GGDEF)-like protein [Spiribacter vilamensis]TVO61462.1 diguanylate cyclase [Spiribacter vilamensis]
MDLDDPAIQAFTDRLVSPLWVFDIERRAMAWANPAAIKLWGADSLASLRARDFGATMTEAVRQQLEDYLRRLEAGETIVDSWSFFPHGNPVTVHCACQPFHLEDGRLAMLVEGTRLDVLDSPTQRALQALRHSSMLVSVYDESLSVISRNPAAAARLGDHPTLGDEFADQAGFQALHEAIGENGEAVIEARLNTADGSAWFREEARRMPDPETGAWLVVIGAMDISDRLASEEKLKTERERLRTLLTSLEGGVLMEDEHEAIVLTNPALCSLFHLCDSPGEMEGCGTERTKAAIAALCTDPRGFLERTREAIANRVPVHGELHELTDGRRIERDFMPIFLEGSYQGHLWQYRDVTQRKAYEQRLRDLANTDPVTELPNRRHIFDRLEEELARTDRIGNATTALLIDIDYFKEINDSHGHDAGDEALVHFAEALRQTLRTTDIAGRIGGDEFLVLLPDTDVEAAGKVAERIQETVGGLHLAGSEAPRGLSLSIGLAPLGGERDDSQKLLLRADAALYEAKSRGRGMVIHCADPGMRDS